MVSLGERLRPQGERLLPQHGTLCERLLLQHGTLGEKIPSQHGTLGERYQGENERYQAFEERYQDANREELLLLLPNYKKEN